MVDRISDVMEREKNLAECDSRHRVCQQGGRPAQPNAANIVVAIERLVADSRAGGGPEIEFYDDVPIDELPSELQAAVFPIVQELLLNASRHSKSRNVLVGLGQDDDRVCIQVQDWGVGFVPEMVQPHKRGLKKIQQLVQWRGGTVNVDSRPGAGTCIVVEIPFVRETEANDPASEQKPR
ncbi:MAG: ATP-binding protein [Thermoguttaceae bacterium]